MQAEQKLEYQAHLIKQKDLKIEQLNAYLHSLNNFMASRDQHYEGV